MTTHLEVAAAETCVWMSAGVLTYKLCDRHFECDNCPLDTALRGTAADDAGQRHLLQPLRGLQAAKAFPADRHYSASHVWLQPCKQRRDRCQFGLDGFAASLVPRPRKIHWNAAPRVLKRGEVICALELDDGLLNLGTPLAARLSEPNALLNENPAAVNLEPYGSGWIAELADVNPEEWSQLLTAQAAHEWARLDLRRLRRRIAMHLLSDGGDGIPSTGHAADSGAEPWHIIGGASYLEFIRELIH